MRKGSVIEVMLTALVVLGCQQPDAPTAPVTSTPVPDEQLQAELRSFVNVDLREVDGAGFDAVCRELLRRYLFTHTELVVREVARAGVVVEANLGMCIDYAVTDSRRQSLLDALRAMTADGPREQRVRALAISRAATSDPDP